MVQCFPIGETSLVVDRYPIHGETDQEFWYPVSRLEPISCAAASRCERRPKPLSNSFQPDGPVAAKPYAVLLDALSSKALWDVAIATISNREQLVVLRAVEGALCIDTLHYAAELRGPAEIWGKLDLPAVGKEEARLAATLMDASTSKNGVDVASFKDTYNTELRSLLEAKIEGREIAAPKQRKREQVINLMDALKKSIASKGRVATEKQITRTSLSRSQGRKPTKRKSAG